MLEYSELYPIQNGHRMMQSLDGMWKFQFDPEEIGENQDGKWIACSGFYARSVQFCRFFTDHKERDYCGDFWYETEFYLPAEWRNKKIWLRFGSITHRGTVYCNGMEITSHEGGFCRCWLTFQQWQNQGKSIRLL